MGNVLEKSSILRGLRGADYKVIYDGRIKVKFVDHDLIGNDIHEYYVSELLDFRGRKEWTEWERVHGPTTYIEIKDKSQTLVEWAVGLFYRSLKKTISLRALHKFDLDLAKELHADKKKQAGNLGSLVHKWIDAYIQGQCPEMPENSSVLHAVNQFLKWKNDLKVEFLTPDILMYSLKYKIAGRADSIIKIGGKVYLWDAKSGNGIYNDAMMQTSGYVKMYNEMGLDKVYGPLAGRVVTRFEKRTEAEFREEMLEKGRPNAIYRPVTTLFFDNNPEQLEDDFQALLHAKGLWEWNKRSEKALKKIKDKADIATV